MNNEKRDKFLTEAMGLCYHDYVEVSGSDSWDEQSACDTLDFKCSKCGDYQEHVKFRDHSGWAVKHANYYDFDSYCFIDFSWWVGFGQLWDWSIKQDWFTTVNGFHAVSLINPDRFADAVYNYLKEIRND